MVTIHGIERGIIEDLREGDVLLGNREVIRSPDSSSAINGAASLPGIT